MREERGGYREALGSDGEFDSVGALGHKRGHGCPVSFQRFNTRGKTLSLGEGGGAPTG